MADHSAPAIVFHVLTQGRASTSEIRMVRRISSVT